MPAGYSGKPLIDKLGLQPGMRVLLLNAPRDYAALLEGDTSGVEFLSSTARNPVDAIHSFFLRRSVLEQALPRLTALLKPGGMLWVSWPKKSSKVPTDITEDLLRAVILPTGLVDTKVCAVDETWSALKFMWRKNG